MPIEEGSRAMFPRPVCLREAGEDPSSACCSPIYVQSVGLVPELFPLFTSRQCAMQTEEGSATISLHHVCL